MMMCSGHCLLCKMNYLFYLVNGSSITAMYMGCPIIAPVPVQFKQSVHYSPVNTNEGKEAVITLIPAVAHAKK
jgi:hypothetical protein